MREIKKRLECLRRLEKGDLREIPTSEAVLRTIKFIRDAMVRIGATYEEIGTTAFELRDLEKLAQKIT